MKLQVLWRGVRVASQDLLDQELDFLVHICILAEEPSFINSQLILVEGF